MWSLFAAIGLFAAGAGVSITHGISELADPEPAGDFIVAYVVLAVSFVLEGISFAAGVAAGRSGRGDADRDLLDHVLETSDPTLRAVFFEDAAALVGILIAARASGCTRLTGSPVPDAIGSILVGVLLAVVAVVLIDRNRRFLVGMEASPMLLDAARTRLAGMAGVSSVGYLHMEFVGPRRVYVVASVDLVGDDVESSVADHLRMLESQLEQDESVVEAVLTVSRPGQPPNPDLDTL